MISASVVKELTLKNLEAVEAVQVILSLTMGKFLLASQILMYITQSSYLLSHKY